jgi:urocanate hydratase
MAPQPTSGTSQSQILRTYTTLCQLLPTWGGTVVLSLGSAGSALSVAANIAGAVSLSIDADPANLREATRAGAVDFTVNTLDEALRAMKNEVRKHAPLSVALNAAPLLALDEILERGLAPQLFSTFLPPHPSITQAATTLHSLGAALVDFTEAGEIQPGFRSSGSFLAPLLEARGWTLQTFTFDTPAALSSFDVEALALLPSEDALRRRWLEAAPRLLQRQRPPHRTLWLTESEIAGLKLPSA